MKPIRTVIACALISGTCPVFAQSHVATLVSGNESTTVPLSFDDRVPVSIEIPSDGIRYRMNILPRNVADRTIFFDTVILFDTGHEPCKGMDEGGIWNIVRDCSFRKTFVLGDNRQDSATWKLDGKTYLFSIEAKTEH